MIKKIFAPLILVLFSLAVFTQVADAWVHKHLQETHQALPETETLSLKENGADFDLSAYQALPTARLICFWEKRPFKRQWHERQSLLSDIPIYLRLETLRL